MKKFIAIIAAAFAVLAFAPKQAEAGHSSCRTVSHCGYCHKPVYAYYKVVGYDHCGRAVYGWVTNYHSNCGRGSSHYHRSYDYHDRGSSYGFSFRFGSPRYHYDRHNHCR